MRKPKLTKLKIKKEKVQHERWFKKKGNTLNRNILLSQLTKGEGNKGI